MSIKIPEFKRINIVTGHYGSGKTNFSINLCLDIAKTGAKACLVDLDIVNPYFRAADMTKIMEQNGIKVIIPIFANTNLDIPAIPSNINNIFNDKSQTIVIDVGGDDAGAAALGQFSKIITDECDYKLFYIFNAKRAMTKSPQEAADILREIEHTSHLKANVLINNTNLAKETDIDILKSSFGYAGELSRLTGLPVEYTAVRPDIAEGLKNILDNIYPVNLYVKLPWDIN